MSYLSERISFIQGLAEGMKIDDENDQGRFLMALVTMLEEIVEAIDEIEEDNQELLDYLQVLEEKLGLLDEDEDDDEFVEIGDEELFDEEGYDELDEDLTERFESVECPECSETVYFDRSMIGSENELICPECNTPITGLGERDEDEE